MTAPEDVLDDLFHGCAFAAYIDQATLEKGPPDCERTRRLAYRYYEEALADRPSRCDAMRLGDPAIRRRIAS